MKTEDIAAAWQESGTSLLQGEDNGTLGDFSLEATENEVLKGKNPELMSHENREKTKSDKNGLKT